MKAIVTLENQKMYEADIFKDVNNLVITFEDSVIVPWDIIRQGNFTIDIKPTEEQIGCWKDCNVCLTPIC